MKKLLLILLLVLTLSLPTESFAESIDISGLSMEELMDLGERVSSELWKKGQFLKTEFYEGRYEAGLDIEPGCYLIEYIAEDGFALRIRLHDSSGKILALDFLYPGEIYFVRLKAGDVLELTCSNTLEHKFTIQPVWPIWDILHP